MVQTKDMSPAPSTPAALQQQSSKSLDLNQSKMDQEAEQSTKNQSNDRHHNAVSSNSSNSSSSVGQLVCCSFNQDGGCLAIGTTTGFSVIQVYPYSLSVQRDLRGSIGGIEMLFRCNIMALVGGGGGESTPMPTTSSVPSSSPTNSSVSTSTPYAPAHRVLIWDDHVPKEIGELSFRQVVLRVKLRRDAIAVALRDRIYVYHLHDLSLRDKIYTADNPQGLLSLSTTVQSTSVSNTSTNTSSNNSSSRDMVLACPSITTGHVRVELYGFRKTVLMEAHQHALQALALTSDGSLLATASTQGTLLRVWNVQQGTCVQEFRRGLERATISCLAWSANSSSSSGTVGVEEFGGHHHDRFGQPQQRSYNQHGASSSSSTYPMGWLACCSDKGTTHVFQLGGGNSTNQSNSSSSASITKRLWNTMLTTATSTSNSSNGVGELKSVAQVRGVPHPMACAFCPSSTTITTLYTDNTPLSNKNVSPALTCPLLAVAGYDVDGNGVLLVSDITPCLTGPTTRTTSTIMEPRRISYHVLCKVISSTAFSTNPNDDEDGDEFYETTQHDNPHDDELRRRRRLLHTKPQQAMQNMQNQMHNASDKFSEVATFLIQDRTNTTMNQFQFDEMEDSEFVAVIATTITAKEEDSHDNCEFDQPTHSGENLKSSDKPAEDRDRDIDKDVERDPPTSGGIPVGSDSVRTEPLEDEYEAANGAAEQTETNRK